MDAWIDQLKREYKNHELPEFNNEIEGISYSFKEQTTPIKGWKSCYLNTQKTFPYSFHHIQDILTARATIMHDLNHGCHGILLTWNDTPDLDQLFQGVHFEYVQTVLCLPKWVNLTPILQWVERNNPRNFYLESGLEELPAPDQSIGYVISGFDAYSSGANAWQELLYVAHYLEQFLHKKSSRPITIEMGIGENTVIELAKFRAMDWLIQSLCEKNQHFPTVKLRCKTGWRNKTSDHVNDNQIRQTMEALCGLISGTHECCVTPYDFAYSKTLDYFVRRMALNAVHILEYEAQLNFERSFHQGSRIVQHHAIYMCDKVWSFLSETSSSTFEEQFIQELDKTIQLRNNTATELKKPPSNQTSVHKELLGVFERKAIYF